MLKLIYIGEEFYRESATMMSSIYTEDGKRSDWGFVQAALKKGEDVNIRQASSVEMEYYKRKLKEFLKKFD